MFWSTGREGVTELFLSTSALAASGTQKVPSTGVHEHLLTLAEATGSVTYSCAVKKRQHTLKMVSDSNSADHHPNPSYEHYGRLYNMTLLRNPTSTDTMSSLRMLRALRAWWWLRWCVYLLEVGNPMIRSPYMLDQGDSGIRPVGKCFNLCKLVFEHGSGFDPSFSFRGDQVSQWCSVPENQYRGSATILLPHKDKQS